MARGTRLRSPSTDETRPILDRAKEALFNILSPRIVGCQFLDLFAGTGGVGIEALSRGAAGATFVEWSAPIVGDLRYNLDKTHLTEAAVVRQMDVFAFLKETPKAFDIVFVGPPQWQSLWRPALETLDADKGWVADDGVVIVQHDPKEYEAVDLARLAEYNQRKYARVQFVFYEPR